MASVPRLAAFEGEQQLVSGLVLPVLAAVVVKKLFADLASAEQMMVFGPGPASVEQIMVFGLGPGPVSVEQIGPGTASVEQMMVFGPGTGLASVELMPVFVEGKPAFVEEKQPFGWSAKWH